MDDQIIDEKTLRSNFWKPAANNPGFDLLVVEGDFVVAVECKFSAPDVDTRLLQSKVEAQNYATNQTLQKLTVQGT